MKKTYILDTSVFLTNYKSIYDYGRNDIVIPLIVLEEIDKHKKRPDSVGLNARNIIRTLDSLREKGNLHKGVRIDKGKGLLKCISPNTSLLPSGLDPKIPDHQIIAAVLTEQTRQENRKVVLVSCDINMRIKCDAIGITAENYDTKDSKKEISSFFTGFGKLVVDDEVIDRLYKGESITCEMLDCKKNIFPNQFIMLISSANNNKTALVRFTDIRSPLKLIKDKTFNTWGIEPKNKEQNFALDLLLDKEIQIITLTGQAGTGKSLIALAAGLSQCKMKNNKNSSLPYKRIIVSRPIQPLGKDIGYLPGTKEEKMGPWLAPIEDNLRFLFGDDNATLEMYLAQKIIEIEALTYIRGRSIQNAFILIDEAQNLNKHEIKTILTRVGHNSKIVLTGDVEQIDNINVDATSNGLTYIIEKFKHHDLAGHMTFQKGERSAVASLSAKIL